MQLLVQLVTGLAWPIVVVWVAYLFKHELTALIARISRFKYKDFEFEIGLAKAEEQVTIIQRTNQIPQLPDPATLRTFEQLRRIAEVSPRAAVIEAWNMVEEAAGRSGFVQGADRPRVNAPLFIDRLVRTGKLPPGSGELIQEMRNLRNRAAHGILALPEDTLTKEDADRYLELAAKVSSLILPPGTE
jgi:hypothetical protein